MLRSAALTLAHSIEHHAAEIKPLSHAVKLAGLRQKVCVLEVRWVVLGMVHVHSQMPLHLGFREDHLT